MAWPMMLTALFGCHAIAGARSLDPVLQVQQRFPKQAEQAVRLLKVEEQLGRKINSVRRRLLSKVTRVDVEGAATATAGE